MKRFNLFILAGLITPVFTMCCSSKNSFEQKVRSSVQEQLKQYPQSTLQDLYKNFFQDKFGPGHIIADADAARRYLDSELVSFATSANPAIEPTGWEHNFYRVNLNVLKKNKIPYDTFLAAFIESVNSVTPLSIEEWKNEWSSIEKIISSMNLSLPNYDNDKRSLDSIIDAGNFAVHHSRIYNQAYEPHYRIISRKVFERDLQKYFNE
ncbi:MAG: hypothetical protein LBG19_11760 [Prevotellaceae bacterium]|jgi:hypothetical protein|nr:hypothetical protein [Prevotellaceae bacterium]